MIHKRGVERQRFAEMLIDTDLLQRTWNLSVGGAHNAGTQCKQQHNGAHDMDSR